VTGEEDVVSVNQVKRPKPVLRGVSHEVALCFSFLGLSVLFRGAESGTATVAAALYGGSLTALFGVSALYHRPMWSLAARRWLKRVDHSMIFVFISGTGTPLALLLGGRTGALLLWVLWAGAALGVARAVFWPGAPRWVAAGSYLLLGWAVVPFLPALGHVLSPLQIALIAAGGLAYSAGAVVYATRWPDPNPKVFGFHEIFHLLVIVAALLHFGVEVAAIRAMH
jgi:hemolysin III